MKYLLFLVPFLLQAQSFLLFDDAIALTEYQKLTTTDTTLVMYLKFDEGVGDTALDSSPNVLANNGGGLKNGATWNATGKSGACLDVDGNNDYVQVPNSASLKLTNNFSISVWVKCHVEFAPAGIITKITDGDAGYTIGIEGGLPYAIAFPDWNAGAISAASIGTEWKHIIAIQDAGINKLYINGVLELDTGTNAVVDNDVNLMIGRVYSTIANFYFNGLIDEVMIFKKVLTSTEILALYNL